jgi:hypothetical protein
MASPGGPSYGDDGPVGCRNNDPSVGLRGNHDTERPGTTSPTDPNETNNVPADRF